MHPSSPFWLHYWKCIYVYCDIQHMVQPSLKLFATDTHQIWMKQEVKNKQPTKLHLFVRKLVKLSYRKLTKTFFYQYTRKSIYTAVRTTHQDINDMFKEITNLKRYGSRNRFLSHWFVNKHLPKSVLTSLSLGHFTFCTVFIFSVVYSAIVHYMSITLCQCPHLFQNQ